MQSQDYELAWSILVLSGYVILSKVEVRDKGRGISSLEGATQENA